MMRLKFNKVFISCVLSIGILSTAIGQENEDISNMSLEDLMNMQITSVSKKAERLQDVASSIYVLSSEDIMRSGATNLHEALRLVPGYWGVQQEYGLPQAAIRYSQPLADKLGTVLYLLDGTPLQDMMNSNFSWRNFDLPLDEIDRIEVIRGSGGTIYGANSATGVVNIFTKSPDKYDGINARVEAANAGYVNTTVRAGGKISEKLALSGYAKMRLFNGFGSLAGTDSDGDQMTGLTTRFTDNYDKTDTYSGGLKAKLFLNEKSSFSLNTHYNTVNTIEYSTYISDQFVLTGQDVLIERDITTSRFVGNLRYDIDFSDTHSLFARISTNSEKDNYLLSGGFDINNAIYDVEIQDNFSLGDRNNLSVGVNYRHVKFDIHNIQNTDAINYTNPQSSETLKGAFVQDKIEFLDGKLNFLLGVKAENYSLINDEFYLSPMAKFSYLPSESITVWGGYTQSYTTSGFNNVNVDLYFFQRPDAAQIVFGQTYQAAIDGGADEATATATAQAFVESPTGQATVAGVDAQLPANVALKNGSDTAPTKFRTWELGFRANMKNKLTFESNFYYTNISDAIGVPFTEIGGESPTQPGRQANYLLYGNYIKGVTYGVESAVKFIPVKGVNLEMNHSFIKSTWELQANDDFDINASGDPDETPSVPKAPRHVLRLKAGFSLPHDINIDVSGITSSQVDSEANYVFESERYTIVGASETNARIVAANDARTIVNLRIEKRFLEQDLSVYVFGNDLFNGGMDGTADPVYSVTRSQISRMVGLGANYRIK